MGRPVGNIFALKEHPAGINFMVPGQKIKKSAFAGAVGADDGGKLTGLHLIINIAGRLKSAEGLVQMLHFKIAIS